MIITVVFDVMVDLLHRHITHIIIHSVFTSIVIRPKPTHAYAVFMYKVVNQLFLLTPQVSMVLL